MNSKDRTIVILTRNFLTGLGTIRALGKAGYTVDVIGTAPNYGELEVPASSKYVNKFTEVVFRRKQAEAGENKILNALKEYSDQSVKPVLFPTDDYSAAFVSRKYDELTDIFSMPHADGDANVLTLMDKHLQAEMASKAGLAVPEEWLVDLDNIAIPENLKYPVYCKPQTTVDGYRADMGTFEAQHTLLSHLQDARKRAAGRSVLLQEFLNIEKSYEITGICNGSEVIIPAVIEKTVAGKRENGITGAGVFKNIDCLGADADKIIEMLKAYNYVGMFNLELHVADGQLYFGEVNLRCGVTSYSYFAGGINMPSLICDILAGDETDTESYGQVKLEKKLVCEQVLWADCLAGDMDQDKFDAFMNEADIKCIADSDDEAPAKAFEAKMEADIVDKSDGGYKRRQLRRCLDKTIEATGWSIEQARADIEETVERVGIDYREYYRYEYYKIPKDAQQKFHDDIWTENKWQEAIAQKIGGIENHKLEKGKTLVVVLTRNYATGLSVVRSLGEAGYTVDLVSNAFKQGMSEIAGASKYLRNYVEVVSRKAVSHKDETIMRELRQYKGKYKTRPVLFPTDDYTASVIDTNMEELYSIFQMPHIVDGEAGSMTALMDKSVQSTLARKAGLPVPLEWVFDLSEELVIPDDMVYPCYCKPVESITGFKGEMATCENEFELKGHLDELTRKNPNRSVLVQEYLNIENEIDLSGVCNDQEVVIPAIIKKTNVAQFETGVTLSGKIVPFDEIAEVKEAVIKFMQSFHYVGMFDLEFNIVGGKLYFNEVNLRSGGPNFSYFMSGVNLPDLFVKNLLGKEHAPEEECVKEYGKHFIYEKIAWEDYINGFFTKRQLKETIAASDITLLGFDKDPKPGKIFEKQIKREARVRKTKEWIKTNIFPILESLNAVKEKLLKYPNTVDANKRNPNSPKPRVIVSGRNYCSNITMAKSLGRAGYEVEVLRIFQTKPRFISIIKWIKPDVFSKYIKSYEVCTPNRQAKPIVDKLIEMADPDRKMLLIPADDLVAYIADDYMDELSQYYYLPNIENKPGEIGRLMAKGVQKELARQAGLPVAGSCVIKTKRGDFSIPDSVTYPCFIKPNISRFSSKSAMRKCDSRAELVMALNELSKDRDVEMLVEDFVEIDAEMSILGVSTKDGANGPGLFIAEEGGQDEHRGVALVGRMLPYDEWKDLVDPMVKFIESLKFEGLYDIDLIKAKDGKIYFVEVNMRFGASGWAVTESGVNLPGMFADYMFDGKPIDKDARIEPGKRFVSEKILIDEYSMNRISRSKIKQAMKLADVHFIADDGDGDKRPYKHFKKYYFVAFLYKFLNGYRDRKEAKLEEQRRNFNPWQN